VTGADTKRIRELGHDSIKTYGTGKGRDKKYWRSVIDELLAQEAVLQEGDPYPVMKITLKGSDILFGRESFMALRKEEGKAKTARQKEDAEGYDRTLFEKLRAVRKRIAEGQEVPPYVVFSDRTLREMCRRFPSALSEMRKISGVGDAKLERYGRDFVLEIQGYLDENPGISVPEPESEDAGSAALPQKKKKGETIEETYMFFKGGMSPDDIAKLRSLAPSTIASHLERLIMDGRDIDMDRVVDPGKRLKIEGFFKTVKGWELNPVVEHFTGMVSYEEARLVRAHLLRNNKA
jgi:ATP-dependent DNA helicase RecQ